MDSFFEAAKIINAFLIKIVAVFYLGIINFTEIFTICFVKKNTWNLHILILLKVNKPVTIVVW